MSDATSAALAQFIWRTRYRAAGAHPPEDSIADTWDRVARSVAATECDPALWQGRFRGILQGFRFLPGGRILAGAGLARQVTLANCFVMGLIEDSIPGIFEALKEGALTLQQGGGIGYDFSTVRPRGCKARTTGMIASGPVSFLHVWDAMCATIMSTGARRGAMMATLRCDHPDIEEFIDAKRQAGALNHFNLSVLVSEAFMQAVRDDDPWPLVFPREGMDETGTGAAAHLERQWSASARPVACRIMRSVPARRLWERLCAAAHACAEPGVLFIDRINAENNLGYREALSATNPCGEEPLPPYGSCNLGALNLVRFVIDPLTPAARLDYAALRDTARLAVRFLDDVIEISRFPLQRQRVEAHRSRRIGLGLTGLADALILLELRYDSPQARDVASQLMRVVRDAAYEASVELAREHGAFELYDSERYAARPFVRRLPETIQAAIRRHGMRNSHLLAIAPAGTISLLAGNVSSGIEPVFQLEAARRVLDPDGTPREFPVADAAYALWKASSCAGRGALPAWLDAGAIPPGEQLLMQSTLQEFVDGSISKTVTLAGAATPDEVMSIFTSAHRLGLKGCTVFREGTRPQIIAARAEHYTSRPDAHCCDAGRESD